MKGRLKKIRALSGLFKTRISLFTAFSPVTGALLENAPGGKGGASLLRLAGLAAGVLFLAFGASALNQLEEAATDALMPRTRNRPIPSGRIKPLHALWSAVALIAAGASILFAFGGAGPPSSGAKAGGMSLHGGASMPACWP